MDQIQINEKFPKDYEERTNIKTPKKDPNPN